MECEGTATVQGRIEIKIAGDAINRAQADSWNAEQQNTDDDQHNEIFFIDIHALWSTMSKVFRFF